jgi:hypothetical protein
MAESRQNEIRTQEDYKSILNPDKIPTEGTADDIASSRLEKILDIRKFEIDLYWKRATYFWTFIAATLTGYGLTVTAKDANQENLIRFQFLIVCFGLVFSFAWFLVNKGSKFWQENWEKHLDLTEDSVIGPLYKTTISRESYSSFWIPTSAYATSVSKINQILSLFVFTIWLGILVYLFVSGTLILFNGTDFYFTAIGLLTFSAIIYLAVGARTSSNDTIVPFDERKIIDKK